MGPPFSATHKPFASINTDPTRDKTLVKGKLFISDHDFCVFVKRVFKALFMKLLLFPRSKSLSVTTFLLKTLSDISWVSEHS